MPTYRAPGVYLTETRIRPPVLAAAESAVTAFVGPTLRGPLDRVSPALHGFQDFERIYGGESDLRSGVSWRINYIARAVRAFFDEGGRRLHVVRTPAPRASDDQAGAHGAALALLDREPDVSIVAAPGYPTIDPGIGRALLAHVERARSFRFALLEFPRGTTVAGARAAVGLVRSPSAAVYWPWVVTAGGVPSRANPQGGDLCLPPSGFVAGVIARVDRERGAHAAPANEVVRSALRFEYAVTAGISAALNPLGVNCLRAIAGRGLRVWGARTTSLDPEWKYVHVRRYVLLLQRSLARNLAWTVFEPTGEPLWAAVRVAIGNLLVDEWRLGALRGSKAEEAFFVRCDRTTMTAADLAAGRVIALVGVALMRPAEFVIFRWIQTTAR